MSASHQPRQLVVTADDFGIGPMTTRGILDLAHRGRVSCSVLLANAPNAEEAVATWKSEGKPMELGWHPCLTLDAPISDPGLVSSLVDSGGQFLSLGVLSRRLVLGKLRADEIYREYEAQFDRFLELVGESPVVVNAHHHLHAFPVIGEVLATLLINRQARPFVRRVREPLTSLRKIPGARVKRVILSLLGRTASSRLDREGFQGNDWLAGITDYASVQDPLFFGRWLATIPGQTVELMCHPGLHDPTLIGRDGSETDGGLARRVAEYHLLADPRFTEAVAEAGFTLTSPSEIHSRANRGGRDVA